MVKNIILKIRRGSVVQYGYTILFKIFSLLPQKKNVIIFESFLGKQYSDNPKAIYLYLKENYPEYKMYWSIDRRKIKDFRNEDITTISRLGLKWIILMSRAKYWVTNSRLPIWIPKPKGTIYIQTWHGTPLKRLGVDIDEVFMPGTDSKKYKKNFIKEASKWDYLISPNAYSTNVFKRAFQFNKHIVESGYPRNDLLVVNNKESKIKLLKQSANLPLNKKVILYAPTWRDDDYYEVGKYKFTLKMNLNKMYEKLGDNYIILLRLHYLVSENVDIDKYRGFVYDMSSYEDINELYLISDILITDYSSVFFDFSILNRPIIFYTYDLSSYRDQLRGFYFDFEKSAPGPLVYTTDELIKVIYQSEDSKIIDDIIWEEFKMKFCNLEDGNATQRVVEEVFR